MRLLLSTLCLAATGLLLSGQEPNLKRFEKSIEAFEKADKANPPPAQPIVFTGSSSIALWKDAPKAFPDLPILNRGFGGSTTPEVVHYADRIVIAYKPRMVVLFCGGNDLAAKHTPEQVVENFRAFVKKVQDALPETPIAYISLHTPPGRVKLMAEHRAVNRMIREECAKNSKLHFVDIHDRMLGSDGLPNPELYRDPLHPTTKAYDLWAEQLRPVLSKSERGSP